MSRKIKQDLVKYFESTVKKELINNKATVKTLNGGSYRIFYKGIHIDYYPGSGKYHNITNNIRGECKCWYEDILKLF